MSQTELEEGKELRLDFNKLNDIGATGKDLIPAVVQDTETGEVLMVGYINKEVLETALREQCVTFWSTWRDEVWIVGKNTGDTLRIIETRVNCEQTAVLFLARRSGGGACHTKSSDGKSRIGCFYRRLNSDGQLEMISHSKPETS